MIRVFKVFYWCFIGKKRNSSMPTRYLQDGLAVRLVKRKPVRKTNQKRLEEFVKGIKGFIDEDAARAILNKRKPAP